MDGSNETVAELGRHGARLAWGFGVYALYYLGIIGLVLLQGVAWSGPTAILQDVVRLAGVLAPLAAYVVANIGFAVATLYLVPMHAAARWAVVAVATAIACIGWALFLPSAWRWFQTGQPKDWFWGLSHLWAIGLGAMLTLGYTFLAYRLGKTVRRLHRFVLIEGVWLPKQKRTVEGGPPR